MTVATETDTLLTVLEALGDAERSFRERGVDSFADRFLEAHDALMLGERLTWDHIRSIVSALVRADRMDLAERVLGL